MHTPYEITMVRFARKQTAFITRLANATLEELEHEYIRAIEEGNEAEDRAHFAQCKLIAEMVENIALYRFGDTWSRP